MRDALIAILLCGLAVAACEAGQADKAETPQISVDLSTTDEGESSDSGLQLKADTETGEMQVKLPGGIEGKIKLPEGLDGDTEFDLGGVGRYPGAKLTGVDINALGGKDGARVELGFTAPGSAETVADWYAKAFAAKGRNVTRSGTTLSTTTGDGEPLVMALRDGTNGVATGQITIRGGRG